MRSLLTRPRAIRPRRLVFLAHFGIGTLAGAYLTVICVTGAALVFRIDLQRAVYPHLFDVRDDASVDLVTVLHSVQAAYPDHVVSGIDAPTATRPNALAYITRGRDFQTVLADPASGRVLGELPDRGPIRTLQELHFNLLSGRTGRVVNGVGAICLLIMCATGVVLWWPRASRWRRAFTVDMRHGSTRMVFELHGAVGIWAVAFISMWAITGTYFAFPAQTRALIDRLLPLSAAAPPVSDPAGRGRQPEPDAAQLLAEAVRHMPGRHAARLVLPTTERGAVQVLFARVTPTPLTPGALEPVYLDRYTGQVLHSPAAGLSAGDRLIAWMVPLHVGNFSGAPVRALWFALAFAPPLLYMTGMVMWWNRSRRERKTGSAPPDRAPTVARS